MVIEDYIRQCKYYDGGNGANLGDQNKNALYWREKAWVSFASLGSKFEDEIAEFRAYVKEVDESRPETLQAIVFNGFASGFSSMSDAAKAWPEFWEKYYGKGKV
ncbi:MAG: hypothetical protein J5382_04635 [Bacteroidales bacterium]|nr:hypothetical protein [Bacteroidales bacterium]